MSKPTCSAWPRSGPASRARGTPRLQQQTWSHLGILSCHWSSYSNTELSLVILMQYTQTVERVPSWSLVLKVHSYFIRWVVYAPFSLSCSRVSWKVAYSRLQRWAHILANPMSFQVQTFLISYTDEVKSHDHPKKLPLVETTNQHFQVLKYVY